MIQDFSFYQCVAFEIIYRSEGFLTSGNTVDTKVAWSYSLNYIYCCIDFFACKFFNYYYYSCDILFPIQTKGGHASSFPFVVDINKKTYKIKKKCQSVETVDLVVKTLLQGISFLVLSILIYFYNSYEIYRVQKILCVSLQKIFHL